MFGIVKDALDGKLAITVLQKAQASAASTVNGDAKEVLALPLAAAAVLAPISCPSAHTLDVLVQGRDAATDSWETLVTFAQVTNANVAVQRANIAAPKKFYRTVSTAAGAFGGAGIPYTVTLVGTNVQNSPIEQVD